MGGAELPSCPLGKGRDVQPGRMDAAGERQSRCHCPLACPLPWPPADLPRGRAFHAAPGVCRSGRSCLSPPPSCNPLPGSRPGRQHMTRISNWTLGLPRFSTRNWDRVACHREGCGRNGGGSLGAAWGHLGCPRVQGSHYLLQTLPGGGQRHTQGPSERPWFPLDTSEAILTPAQLHKHSQQVPRDCQLPTPSAQPKSQAGVGTGGCPATVPTCAPGVLRAPHGPTPGSKTLRTCGCPRPGCAIYVHSHCPPRPAPDSLCP